MIGKIAQDIADISQKTIYPLEEYHTQNAVISLGLDISQLSPDTESSMKDVKNFILHPISKAHSDLNQYRYEVESEEGVALLLGYFLDIKHKAFEDLDIGYISSESNCSEEDFQDLKDLKEIDLLIGSDLYHHPLIQNITKILGLIAKRDGVRVFCQGLDCVKSPQKVVSIHDIKHDDIKEHNGSILYLRKKPSRTPKCYEDDDRPKLKASKVFCNVAKLEDRKQYKISLQDISLALEVEVIACEYLSGMIAILDCEEHILNMAKYPYKLLLNRTQI